jgi:hypothetical protein
MFPCTCRQKHRHSCGRKCKCENRCWCEEKKKQIRVREAKIQRDIERKLKRQRQDEREKRRQERLFLKRCRKCEKKQRQELKREEAMRDKEAMQLSKTTTNEDQEPINLEPLLSNIVGTQPEADVSPDTNSTGILSGKFVSIPPEPSRQCQIPNQSESESTKPSSSEIKHPSESSTSHHTPKCSLSNLIQDSLVDDMWTCPRLPCRCEQNFRKSLEAHNNQRGRPQYTTVFRHTEYAVRPLPTVHIPQVEGLAPFQSEGNTWIMCSTKRWMHCVQTPRIDTI